MGILGDFSENLRNIPPNIPRKKSDCYSKKKATKNTKKVQKFIKITGKINIH